MFVFTCELACVHVEGTERVSANVSDRDKVCVHVLVCVRGWVIMCVCVIQT